MKVVLRLVMFLTLVFAVFGCDTENNLDPRFEDYFIKYYGADGDQQGVDFEILDDGFLVLGNSVSSAISKSQVVLVRTDFLGNEIWQRDFGGMNDEVASAVEVDDMGNIYVSVTIRTEGGDKDVKILKVNLLNGEPLDSVIVGEVGFDESANNILIVNNGDVLLTGYTTNVDTFKPGFNATTDLEDIFSIRATADLDTLDQAQWRRVSGFPGIDRGVEIVQQSDGSFLFFGTTDRPPTSNEQDGLNMFLFPANGNGVAISTSELQLFGSSTDQSGVQIVPTFGGGYAMIGTASDGPGNSDGYLVRVGSDINLIGINTITPNSNNRLVASSVIEDINGGFLILGNEFDGSNSDIYLTKISSSGQALWERFYGGIDADLSGKVKQMSDGSVVILGTIRLESQTKIALIKTNPSGQLRPL